MKTILALAMALAVGTALPAAAADLTSGEWLRDTGASHIKFAPCGKFLCGTITWLKDPASTPAKIGQKVYYDMQATGENTWEGKAFNPEDSKEYSGKMTLKGNTLTTEGCVLFICKATSWTRL